MLYIFFIIILVLIILLGYYINSRISKSEKEDKKHKDESINTLIDHNSILYQTIYDTITDEFLNDELNHMISRELFKLFAREKLYDYIKLQINTNEYHFHISSDVLKEAATKIIYNDNDIDNILNKMFDSQLGLNISECEEQFKEHEIFIKQFNENSKVDLELHPKESKFDESESEETGEITLDDIISTGTVEDI